MMTSNSASQPVASRRRERASRSERKIRRSLVGALPSLTSLQAAAQAVYGRLERDRALVWTLEELGELAQAVRRAEGPARLEEELGQLTAWMLCLANILGVDLAAAVRSAIEEEIERQVSKYGKLKPYQAESAIR
jgi:NTP pyrophosphatase (non-canonical NTP hydrolase)